MLYTIEIKELLADCQIPQKGILGKLHDTEARMAGLSTQLTYRTDWAGDAHARCLMALKLIREYTEEIERLFDELGVCLKGVCDDAARFATVSQNTATWRSW
jgi:hypothetical protein